MPDPIDPDQPARAQKNGTAIPRPAGRPEPGGHKPAGHSRGGAPARSAEERAARPRRGRIRMIALAVALVAVVSLVTVITWRTVSSPRRNDGASAAALPQQAAQVRAQAASWVLSQVNPEDEVSCDQAMCNALRAQKWPAGKLLVLGPTSPPPVSAVVVVVTQLVRALFGSSIDSAWAPDVLASMGSGAAQVTIRLIAPHGALSYQEQLSAGVAGRQSDAQVLLTAVRRIQLSVTARQQLAAGQVDSRLVLALTSLAGAEPITIIKFGNVGSGASPAVPLRYADLALTGNGSGLAIGPYLQAMRAHQGQLNPQYRPASVQTVPGPGGPVLRVAFTAPSPFGSVSGSP